jgi:hypothetical protein
MGHGAWTARAYSTYASTTGYTDKSVHEVFSSRAVNKALNPFGVTVRESRDSDEHPNSIPIILGLDVTGSMGIYAHEIAVTHLPKLMNGILETVTDPQIMFMAIDDVHACSPAALQASQFESDIRILEQLREVYLVGGGGGNASESYDLTWYFAANRTAIDSFEKRGQHGFLFTFGDEEAPYQTVTAEQLKSVFGPGEYTSMTPEQMLKQAQEMYQVFHIVIEQGNHYRRYPAEVRSSWTNLMGSNVLFLKDSAYLSDLVLATIEIANGTDIKTVIQESVCPDILTYAFTNSLG